MTVKPPARQEQGLLFDVPPDCVFRTPAEARARYGALVQTVVCRAFGLAEIAGSGRYDVVYDAHDARFNQFYEIKSVHAANKVPLYLCRLEKDRASGVDPVYLFAVHRVRGAKSASACLDGFAGTLAECVALPLATVSGACEGRTVRHVRPEVKGSRMGYERKGYCDGYVNLPVSVVRSLASDKPVAVVDIELWGRDFSIALRCEPSIEFLFTT